MTELSKFNNYSETKDKLIVRLVNYDNYKEVLKDTYCMKIGDIAATICVVDGRSVIVLPKEILDKYIDTTGSFSKLFMNTCVNTRRLYPPKAISDPFDVILNDFKNPYDVTEIGLTGIIITNNDMFLGSSAILFPGLLKKISQKAANGNDLLIAFTSVHEVVIHKINKDIGPEEIEESILEVNSELNKGDCSKNFLTNKVYVYYAAQDCIREYN